MSHVIKLPTDKKQRESVVNDMILRGKRLRNIQSAKWWFTHHYIQGARHFTSIDYENGSVELDYIEARSKTNVLEFKYEGIVSKYVNQLGRLQKVDLSPVLSPGGISLDGLRKSSVAQTVLSGVFPPKKVLGLGSDIWAPLLLYGTVGLSCWAIDANQMGIEVVPPWEIIPIPASIARPTDARGLIRRRRVPLEWVKAIPLTKNKGVAWDEMERIRMPVGETAVDPRTDQSTGGQPGVSTEEQQISGMKGDAKKDKTSEEIVEFAETWTFTEDNHLNEYEIWAGGRELFWKEYSSDRMYPPMQIARYIDAGGFWGRSYVDTLISLNQEMEYLASKLFQNVEELDIYGLLLEPTNLGIPAEIYEGRDGLKRVRYEPDYTTPTLSPGQIKPVNSGLAPVRVLQTAKELFDDVASQPTELLRGDAPGRVDNSAGLGLLVETANTPLIPVATGISIAVSNCYRYILGHVRNTWTDGDIINISHLDDQIAGLKFDAETGEITLNKNAIPHPDEVKITIASQLPKSDSQTKMQLMESLKVGIITPMEFRIAIRKENLDFPVGNEVEWQNYRRATLENIQLFGDGETPGKIVVTDLDMHEVHLMVLDGMMARPEFMAASPKVRDAFTSHRTYHLAGLGVIPQGMDYPEEAAGQYMEEMKMNPPNQMGPHMNAQMKEMNPQLQQMAAENQ